MARKVIPVDKRAGKNKGGRPSHKPDDASRRSVQAMAGYGILEIDIAKVVGIDPKTLRKHYRDELDTGHIRANARVAESLYQQAINGNVTAGIWWTKARMGWSEKTYIDHTSGDGSMSPRGIDASKLSDLALRELMDARRSEDQ